MKWTREVWADTHHVVVVKRGKWRPKRYYLNGNRVRRWHPFLRALRGNSYARTVLGI